MRQTSFEVDHVWMICLLPFLRQVDGQKRQGLLRQMCLNVCHFEIYNAARTFFASLASGLFGLNVRNFTRDFLASALLSFQYCAIP